MPIHALFHIEDLFGFDIQCERDTLGFLIGECCLAVFFQLSEIEEKFSLILRSGALDDAPVSDDVFLNFRSNPMDGKSHEAGATIRVVSSDGFHQANVAFLNEIGVREAVAQKATSNGDYQAKMGEHEFLCSLQIILIA